MLLNSTTAGKVCHPRCCVEEIVKKALWGSCGSECEFCSGCDSRGSERIEAIYQPYIDGLKEIAEINEKYKAPFVKYPINYKHFSYTCPLKLN